MAIQLRSSSFLPTQPATWANAESLFGMFLPSPSAHGFSPCATSDAKLPKQPGISAKRHPLNFWR
jgi:hypothetical protein